MMSTTNPDTETLHPRTDDGGEILDPSILERQRERHAAKAEEENRTNAIRTIRQAIGELANIALVVEEGPERWLADKIHQQVSALRAALKGLEPEVRRG